MNLFTSRFSIAHFARASVFAVVLVSAIFGLSVPASIAGLFTLVDDNSVADFDTTTGSNAYDWEVDGEDQLFEQSFWFRVGNVAEQNLNLLPHPIEGTTDTNFDGNADTLFVRYNGAGFRVDVRYVLDGGAVGSRASDIAEQISITNLSGAPLDFHFFQYSDFDLNGTSGGDSAVFPNANAVRQSEGALSIAETVITPVPSHREIDFYDATLDKLEDAFATTLSDAPATGVNFGPGDLTWAYQWDVVIPVGGSFQISKDKNLTGVPEPAGIVLLALGLGAAISAARRRHTA
jgi:hypothetical protein